MKTLNKLCKICRKEIRGRSDKIFCSLDCKNYYHINLRRATKKTTIEIDKILHRNRSILLEIMGKNRMQKKVPRSALDQKKFHYKFHTHSHTNVRGKTIRYLYDFGWVEFSDQEVLILRKRNR